MRERWLRTQKQDIGRSPRLASALEYDAKGKRVVLFGGYVGEGPSQTGHSAPRKLARIGRKPGSFSLNTPTGSYLLTAAAWWYGNKGPMGIRRFALDGAAGYRPHSDGAAQSRDHRQAHRSICRRRSRSSGRN